MCSYKKNTIDVPALLPRQTRFQTDKRELASEFNDAIFTGRYTSRNFRNCILIVVARFKLKAVRFDARFKRRNYKRSARSDIDVVNGMAGSRHNTRTHTADWMLRMQTNVCSAVSGMREEEMAGGN